MVNHHIAQALYAQDNGVYTKWDGVYGKHFPKYIATSSASLTPKLLLVFGFQGLEGVLHDPN